MAGSLLAWPIIILPRCFFIFVVKVDPFRKRSTVSYSVNHQRKKLQLSLVSPLSVFVLASHPASTQELSVLSLPPQSSASSIVFYPLMHTSTILKITRYTRSDGKKEEASGAATNEGGGWRTEKVTNRPRSSFLATSTSSVRPHHGLNSLPAKGNKCLRARITVNCLTTIFIANWSRRAKACRPAGCMPFAPRKAPSDNNSCNKRS